MIPDAHYIPLTLLNQYFVDQNSGLPLAGGSLSFYRDVSRGDPKTVYQLVSTGGNYSFTPLPNPVPLGSVGTVVNADPNGINVAIYAYPFITDPASGNLTTDLYYVVCKDSLGNVQWTREAIPTLNAGNDPIGSQGTVVNELSNPQFTQYFLQDSTVTLSVPGTTTVFPIAPDWDIVASGTGNITVQRVPVSGNQGLPTYPAYYLSVTVGTGVTNPVLRQRLYQNSGIWSGQYLSGFFAAKAGIGSNGISMIYADASGVTSNVQIFSAQLTSSWAVYGGNVELGNSSDTLSGQNAYVDILISLPLNNTTDITSLQIVVNTASFETEVQTYDQRSANRELALMGDYYLPRLEYKNVPSLLSCWDFVKNPRQTGEAGTVAGNSCQYIWDQTILQTDGGLTVDYATNPISNGLALNHQNANLAYAIIQYLDQEDASKFVGTSLSVNVNGYTTAGGNAAAATLLHVKLFANAAANQFGTLPTSLVTLDNVGTITLTGAAISNGWYEIPRNNLPTATGLLNPLSASLISYENDLSFNHWNISDGAKVDAGVQGFAIVVSLTPALSTTDYFTCIDSISVTPGDIATRPAPQSVTEALYDAQRFYETSFDQGTVIPTATNTGIYSTVLNAVGGNSNMTLSTSQFMIPWLAFKRIAPSLTLYSGASITAGNVFALLQSNSVILSGEKAISLWAASDINQKRALFPPPSPLAQLLHQSGGAQDDSLSGIIQYHYVADARIGIV